MSQGLFWTLLPAAFLFAMLLIYAKGEISGGKLLSLFRRVLVAMALLVAFPQISDAATSLEIYLVKAFGGGASLTEVFSHIADRAKAIQGNGSFNWLKVGQIGLGLVATLSFLVLSVVEHFLDVLHLTVWNLLHILGPLALLGCLFDSWQQVPKGIFMGILELSLWKPIWVIMARLLIAIGFGETPPDPSQWFDTVVMNFAVTGLIASTPMIVHGLLSGTMASVGAGAYQTAIAGTGAMMAAIPMKAIKSAAGKVKSGVTSLGGSAVSRILPKRKNNSGKQKGRSASQNSPQSKE